MIRVTNAHVPSWGLPVVFSPAFTSLPTVLPVAQILTRAAVAVAITLSGCTIIVLDSSGRSVGGLVDYTAS